MLAIFQPPESVSFGNGVPEQIRPLMLATLSVPFFAINIEILALCFLFEVVFAANTFVAVASASILSFLLFCQYEPLRETLQAYADAIGYTLKTLSFQFDGDVIDASSTPKELELETGFCIDVMRKTKKHWNRKCSLPSCCLWSRATRNPFMETAMLRTSHQRFILPSNVSFIAETGSTANSVLWPFCVFARQFSSFIDKTVPHSALFSSCMLCFLNTSCYFSNKSLHVFVFSCSVGELFGNRVTLMCGPCLKQQLFICFVLKINIDFVIWPLAIVKITDSDSKVLYFFPAYVHIRVIFLLF